MKTYADIHPIETRIPAKRQSAKRHYGVHPYFTRRPYNVVRDYILHYSSENDLVLDPFGGSGITAVESFLENRTGIQNDINPLANFVAEGIAELSKGDLSDYKAALLKLKDLCETQISRVYDCDAVTLEELRKRVRLPPNIRLPSNSDVGHYLDLFTTTQLVSLAILREAISELPDKYAAKGMLLAWSATLGKLNKTFLSAKGRAQSRGGSSIFSIYRYKVAKRLVELPPWETFFERALNVISAKEEIDRAIELKERTGGWTGQFRAYSFDISELTDELKGKIDYIFTDPPYGGHISYIDLSTLWNSWLGLTPSLETRGKELIVGGQLKLKEEDYVNRLRQSIRDCLRMLKPDRWLSVVFQHWNVQYFKAILTGAQEEKGVLKAAVSQIGDPIWSMHKKKNKESVLAGELILTFMKSGKAPEAKNATRFDLRQNIKTILDTVESNHIYGESLFNHLIIAAWRNCCIDELDIGKQAFIEILNKLGWAYDPANHYWTRERFTEETLFPIDSSKGTLAQQRETRGSP